MNIFCPYLPQYNFSFGTNYRSYNRLDGENMRTTTTLFREDLNWNKFTNYIINNFKNKENVNVVQIASSDGSEAFSLIISLLEKDAYNNKNFPIKAYDIDLEVIKAANSGKINANNEDIKRLHKNKYDFDKYFTETNDEINMKHEVFTKEALGNQKIYKDIIMRPYNVSDEITKRVEFNYGEMFDVVKNIEDNSNTVLLCRNVIGYLNSRQTELFTDLVSRTLKKGSMFVIGDFDTKSHQFLDLQLQHKGFKPVTKNVYRKM